MSSNIARHRATPVRKNPFNSLSKAVVSNRGAVGRGAVVVTAASGLMLGAGAPAMAGAGPSTTPAPVYAPAAAVATVAAPAAAQAETAGVINHTVRSGDTLGSISASYGVNLSSVLQLNGLNMATVIYPGDVIRVSSSFVAPAAQAPVAPAPAPAPQQQTMAASAPVAAPAATANVMLASSTITPIAAASSSVSGNAVAGSAQSQVGQFQDCTALVERALRAAGVAGVGDESPASLLRFGTPTSNPQPGDMVYYSDAGAGVPHIAVYIGGGNAVHGGWMGNTTAVFSAEIGSGPVYYSTNG
ncbi:C40 family peptidase [Arthrobacter roseus]|uniref:C40 family peptidase n=1 Tax=Arthrobacter roseus TaxID=136274 RepID=UPI001965FC4F|nr:LysM peptidoglycan-binding domain-containing protein [Arthrobacter roseus]MBM7849458.1 LysM repeat protein [Arthrobacter roseus]